MISASLTTAELHLHHRTEAYRSDWQRPASKRSADTFSYTSDIRSHSARARGTVRLSEGGTAYSLANTAIATAASAMARITLSSANRGDPDRMVDHLCREDQERRYVWQRACTILGHLLAFHTMELAKGLKSVDGSLAATCYARILRDSICPLADAL